MSALAFVVPGKPCGVNAARHGNWRRPFGKSRAASEYMDRVASYGMQARRMAGWPTTRERVVVTVRVFFQDERPDIDGPLKLTLDALQESSAILNRVGAGIVKNDKQVRRVVLEREVDRDAPRVEIEVVEVARRAKRRRAR